jgi:hypothetical protein
VESRRAHGLPSVLRAGVVRVRRRLEAGEILEQRRGEQPPVLDEPSRARSSRARSSPGCRARMKKRERLSTRCPEITPRSARKPGPACAQVLHRRRKTLASRPRKRPAPGCRRRSPSASRDDSARSARASTALSRASTALSTRRREVRSEGRMKDAPLARRIVTGPGVRCGERVCPRRARSGSPVGARGKGARDGGPCVWRTRAERLANGRGVVESWSGTPDRRAAVRTLATPRDRPWPRRA